MHHHHQRYSASQHIPADVGVVVAGDPVAFGRYQLTRRIAVGGMAEIFEAQTAGVHGFQKRLVIKRMLPELASDQDSVDMFIDEAQVMAAMDCPRIVQVHDFGVIEDQYFIAMEYVEGINAMILLQRCAEMRRRPQTSTAIQIICEVLDALDYAHRMVDAEGRPMRVVHRDVSPSNIFISSRGDVRLGDFGIARANRRRCCTKSGVVKGKYGYMSPEQINGEVVDHRTDIFSAAVVLSELLMVRRLFIARTEMDLLLQVRDARLDRLSQYGAHIPPAVREILEVALARDPAMRYPDASSFRNALQHYLLDEGQVVGNSQVRKLLLRLEPGRARRQTSPLTPSPEKQQFSTTAAAITAPSDPPGRPAAARAVGRKRRVTYLPPEVVPHKETHRSDTGEEPRLATRDALAAIPELRSGDGRPSEHSVKIPAIVGAAAEIVEPHVVIAERYHGEIDEPCDDAGDLGRRSVTRLLFLMALGEQSGLLLLSSGEVRKEIQLLDGHPQSVVSNQPSELFGHYLVRRQAITEGELSMALAMLPHFQGRLGDALVGLELMTPIQILRHLTQQVRRKLLDLFDWNHGRYEFYAGLQREHRSAPLGLDAFALIGAGVAQMPVESLLLRLRPMRDQRCRQQHPPPLPPEVFQAGGLCRRLYDELSQYRRIGELIDHAEASNRLPAYLRALYLLLETGLLATEP